MSCAISPLVAGSRSMDIGTDEVAVTLRANEADGSSGYAVLKMKVPSAEHVYDTVMKRVANTFSKSSAVTVHPYIPDDGRCRGEDAREGASKGTHLRVHKHNKNGMPLEYVGDRYADLVSENSYSTDEDGGFVRRHEIVMDGGYSHGGTTIYQEIFSRTRDIKFRHGHASMSGEQKQSARDKTRESKRKMATRLERDYTEKRSISHLASDYSDEHPKRKPKSSERVASYEVLRPEVHEYHTTEVAATQPRTAKHKPQTLGPEMIQQSKQRSALEETATSKDRSGRTRSTRQEKHTTQHMVSDLSDDRYKTSFPKGKQETIVTEFIEEPKLTVRELQETNVEFPDKRAKKGGHQEITHTTTQHVNMSMHHKQLRPQTHHRSHRSTRSTRQFHDFSSPTTRKTVEGVWTTAFFYTQEGDPVTLAPGAKIYTRNSKGKFVRERTPLHQLRPIPGRFFTTDNLGTYVDVHFSDLSALHRDYSRHARSEFSPRKSPIGSVATAMEDLADHPEDKITVVEIPEIVEVIKEVPRKEIVYVDKQVPVYTEEIVERIVEIPTIQEIERVEEYEEIEEKIVYVPTRVVVDVPKETIKYVPRIETKIIEQVVEVPRIIEKERMEIVEQQVATFNYIDVEMPMVVAQVLQPVLIQDESGELDGEELCNDFVPEIIPIEVFVPKPVHTQSHVVGSVTEHATVDIPPSQWNSLLEQLNPHLDQHQDMLPYLQDHNGAVSRAPGSKGMPIDPRTVNIIGYEQRRLVGATSTNAFVNPAMN